MAKIPVPQQAAGIISSFGCFTQIQAALPNLLWKTDKIVQSLTEQLLHKMLSVLPSERPA